MTWIQAQQHCRNGGSNLVSINSHEELDLLNTMLLCEATEIIYIGLKIDQVRNA